MLKGKSKEKHVETVELNDLVDVKGWKAAGNRLSQYVVKKVKLVEPMSDQPADHSNAQEHGEDIDGDEDKNNNQNKKDDKGYGVGDTIELDF